MIKKWLLLSALALISAQTHAQNTTDTLLFFLNRTSNIYIKARINQSDTLALMFHSTASGITLTQAAVDKKLTLRADSSLNVQSWGGSANARYSEGNSLTIGKMKWDSMTIFTNENSGAGTDGKFGYDLFESKIIEIDYNNKWMLIHTQLPKIPKGYKKMGLVSRQGSIYIAGALTIGEKTYRDTFMYHSGYGGAILLDPKIAETYDMKAKLQTISTSELRDSYNNIIKIETKLLPKLKVGGRTLHDVPLSFAAQSSKIPMKVFGNDLLKRFNVIFDFQQQVVYMKLNSLHDVAYTVKK